MGPDYSPPPQGSIWSAQLQYSGVWLHDSWDVEGFR
jgi:hypothetical protein